MDANDSLKPSRRRLLLAAGTGGALAELKGKVVLDTGNPFPSRDGDMANEARSKGPGIASS